MYFERTRDSFGTSVFYIYREYPENARLFCGTNLGASVHKCSHLMQESKTNEYVLEKTTRLVTILQSEAKELCKQLRWIFQSR